MLVAAITTFLWKKYFSKEEEYNLAGKNIFITGCDSGFGYSLAVYCSNIGMNVVAGCFVDSDGRRHLSTLDNVTVVSLDVTDTESVTKATDTVRKVCGDSGLHCLVNNAATLVFGETLWQTETMVQRQLDVNMMGPLRLIRSCFPLLMSSGSGRIVNMISNCTECPLPTLGPYTASKVMGFDFHKRTH